MLVRVCTRLFHLALLFVASVAHSAAPDPDSCTGWIAVQDDAKKSGDAVKIALAAQGVAGQILGYTAVRASQQKSEWMMALLIGPGSEKNRDAVNAWMLQFCGANPKAMTMDGVQALAPQILRDGAVPMVSSTAARKGPDLETCTGWLAAMDADKNSPATDNKDDPKFKVYTELGAYGAIRVNEHDFWKDFLIGPRGLQNIAAANEWMSRFCKRNPKAKFVDGIAVLAPQIRRDGIVK